MLKVIFNRIRKIKNNQGSAVVMALMILILVSMLSAGILVVTTTETLISSHSSDHQKVLNVAEAGADITLAMISNRDPKVDTNGDGNITPSDFPVDLIGEPYGIGNYDANVNGVFSSEPHIIFRIEGSKFDKIEFHILENGSEIYFAEAQQVPGEDVLVAMSFYYDDTKQYDVRLVYYTSQAGATPIWIIIDGNQTKIYTFNSGGGTTTKEATVPIDSFLNQAVSGDTPYEPDVFKVKITGHYEKSNRTVELVARRDSFLKYSRFVCEGDLGYSSGAVLSGMVYCGGNLNLPTSGMVTFLRDVYVGGSVVNPTHGDFKRILKEGVTDMACPKDDAGCSMDDGKETAITGGLYFSSTTTINFTLFDLTATPPTYNGSPIAGGFNGVIYVEGDAHVYGTVVDDSITVYASDNIVIDNSIYTAGVTADNCSVNVGLISKNDVLISKYAPRVLEINAALVSVNAAWKPEDVNDTNDTDHSHPDGRGTPPSPEPSWWKTFDIDHNGLIENPNIGNWNEKDITQAHPTLGKTFWFLWIKGPIITHLGGSAGAWSAQAALLSVPTLSLQTRAYDYDMDVVNCPPRGFCRLRDWEKLSWREIIED